jgi:preprotein translocase subunit SecY
MFDRINSVFSTALNCLKIPELKSRILFMVLVLFVVRLISLIPVPGLDGSLLSEFLAEAAEKNDNSLLGMYSLFTGGALERCGIGSLGIMPYISATIIIQLLTAVLPGLGKLAREEGGRSKVVQIGRYLTVVLCLGQGFFMSLGWEKPEALFPGFSGNLVLFDPGWIWAYRIQTVLVLTTGTLLLMWLGEQITERGIGNGISLVITIGILARLPQALQEVLGMFFPGEGIDAQFGALTAVAMIGIFLIVTAVVIAVTQAQRKIPVQYAQRAVGRKVYAGGSSFMPLRVNYAGVMPIIFAQAILMFPDKILTLMARTLEVSLFDEMAAMIQYGSVGYMIFEGLMILFFSYFWVATQFNEIQIADDLKKYGGYIPGVRPGNATSEFLHRTMSRITFAGAMFLTAIAIIPLIINRGLNIPFGAATFFGGTSLLITVGVVLDTMRQVESHLLTRHYDGFLKKGRIKGR